MNTSVDLPCGSAVAGMVQEWLHKRRPTLWGSCDWHGAGMVTQVLTYLVEKLWLAWCRNGNTSVDLPGRTAVAGMVQEW